ncbi:MAG: SprB repeat-containing protein [Bacteroidales bacterium]|nr:SprB repeat-containing protein [Bacteroidales bacterium]
MSGLNAGTYSVTITDANGCTTSASATVNENAAPINTSTAVTNVTCNGDADGAINLTVTGGTPPYSFSWSNGDATEDISGLSAGTYNVTITDNDGTTANASATVSQPAALNTPLQSVDCSPGIDNATVTVTSPIGAGLEYSMDGSGYQTSVTFTGVANGIHSITVRNGSGCSTAGNSFTVSCGCVNGPSLNMSSTSGSTCGTESVTIGGNTFTNATSVSISHDGAGSVSPATAVASPFTFTYIPAAGDEGNTVIITITTDNPSGAPCTPDVAIYTLNVNSIPLAPVSGTITQPTCALATGSVVLSGLPSGNWTINPGAITGSGTSTTLTGLSTGTYNFTVTNAAGCPSPESSDIVIDVQPVTPNVTDQTTSISSGTTFTVTPAGVPAGTTYTWDTPIYTGTVSGGTAQSVPQSAISGTLNGSGTSSYTVTPVSGACTGSSFIVTVTVNSGCVPVTIGVQPTSNSMCATSGNITFSIVANGTSPFTYQWEYNNGGTWAAVANGTPAGAVYTNANTATMSVAGITTSGSYDYRAYITNCSGADNATSNAVTLTTVDTPGTPAVGAITQPSSCASQTGSVVLSGLPATGTWTINPGAITGTGTITTITGLAAATYNFTVSTGTGCTSPQSADVVITPAPGIPATPVLGAVTQPSSCAVPMGSVVLSGLPATGTWTINPGSIAGTGTSTTITNLVPGTYSFTVTSEEGCSSLATANVVINPAPAAPPVPTVGTITQPASCAAPTGSVVLSGLPATGVWTINPGSIAGTGTTTTIANLIPGSYNFSVTSEAGCISLATSPVVINAAPVAPPAPIIGTITQPASCAAPTGSVVLTGLPATGTWTINPGAIAGTGTTVTIANLSPGTYNFNVTSEPGCISVESASVVINPAPVAPTAPIIGVITQPASCIATTGSVVLNGLPATGIWTINPGAISGTGTTVTIANLTPGTYNFDVTSAAGCISRASADVIINDAPAAPTAPIVGTITQPASCIATTGSVVLNGLPATGTWTINPGGITGTGTTTTISNLAPGTYNFTIWSDPGCISNASADIIINDPPAAPTAPVVGTITQPVTCAATTGSVVLTGLPATGTWTINPGAITGTGTSTTIANLIPGTYTFSVTSAAGCISNPSADVIINSPPPAPTAPIVGTVTQPSSCAAPTGTVVLNGLPATGTWTINPGSIAGTGTSATITNLIPGTYSFNVTSEAGCISLPSSEVVINDAPATLAPIIGTITQPASCAVPNGSVVLSGLPATGTWTINPGAIAGTGTTTTIANLIPGSYNFYVTNEAGCISFASATVVINAAPLAPAAPIIGTVTQPASCAAPAGSIVLNGLPATGTWTINPGAIAGTGTTTTLTNLAPGTYSFNVTSEAGCISVESASVVINPAPVAPTAPIIGVITQPASCIATTGSVVLNGLPATGIWTINPGAISGTGTTVTIANLTPGTYNLMSPAPPGVYRVHQLML